MFDPYQGRVIKNLRFLSIDAPSPVASLAPPLGNIIFRHSMNQCISDNQSGDKDIAS